MLSLRVWGDTCSCAKCFCGFFITSFNQFFISSISILVTPYIKISLLPSLSCSPILIGSSLLYIYTSAYSIYPNVAGVSIDKPACCRYTCLTFMHTRLDVLTYPVLPPCLSYILSTHWSTNCNILENIFYPKIFPYAFFVFYIFGLSTMSLVYPELTFTYITKHCILLLYVWISSCCRVIIYPLNSFIKK